MSNTGEWLFSLWRLIPLHCVHYCSQRICCCIYSDCLLYAHIPIMWRSKCIACMIYFYYGRMNVIIYLPPQKSLLRWKGFISITERVTFHNRSIDADAKIANIYVRGRFRLVFVRKKTFHISQLQFVSTWIRTWCWLYKLL